EEMPPVKHKELESGIPGKASGAAIYAADPSLRAFNALERHRTMARDIGRSVDPDMKAAAALRNHIGFTRPAMRPDDMAAPGQALDGQDATTSPAAPQTRPDRAAAGASPAPATEPAETGGHSPDARRPMSE